MNEYRARLLSPPTREDFTCASKRRYESERQAILAGERRSETIGFNLYVYRCKTCKGWHLTKKFHHLGRPMKKARTTP